MATQSTFIRRGQNETFPLQGLPGSEICVLQDVRYESFGLPWDDWLTWGEAEDLMIRMPRNNFEESVQYTGTAPLFATMADLLKYPAAEAKSTGRDVEKENRQFRSRWEIIRFKESIPQDERDVTIKPCPKCAAEWFGEAIGTEPPLMNSNAWFPAFRSFAISSNVY